MIKDLIALQYCLRETLVKLNENGQKSIKS